MCDFLCFFFFFSSRRRHTRLQGDWSSDVCSSDLGPLGRLVTAAERFGGGDLRPVTTGEMPREFRLLAEAMQRMGDRLRHIVGDVIGESDRIAGSAGDLSAVSEQLAASSSEVSTAMVEISSGA